jgi:hypothetical protein
MPSASPPTSRRRFLAFAGGAVLAAGSAIALVRTSHYDLPRATLQSLRSLAPWEYVVVQAAARRIAASDRPADASVPTPDTVDVAGFVDGYVATMAPVLRRDLSRLFAYLEHLAPMRSGHLSRFSQLDPAGQDAVLAAMERADEGLLRGGFAGLKSLVFMGYYRDPRTWAVLDYDGPMLERSGAR